MTTIASFFADHSSEIILVSACGLAIFCLWLCRSWLTIASTLAGAVLLAGVWIFAPDDETSNAWQARFETAQQDAESLRNELTRAKEQLSDITEAHRNTLENHARALEAIYRKAGGQREHDETVVTIAGNQKRYQAAYDQVSQLQRDLDKPAINRDESDRRDAFTELTQLRDRLAYGYATDDYEVEVLPDNELISGQKGKYYTVDLKDAASGIKFRFGGGKYTLERSDQTFRKALTAFVGDVAKKMEGNVRFGFFVRGSADRVPYRGQLLNGYKYSNVNYLKSVGEGRYELGKRVHTVSSAINNSDLPFLRARFLKEVVETTYPVKPPVVLEGEITDRRSGADRNVELILYVDW